MLRSPGQPLDAGTRAYMESRFGHDFAQVRVHTDTLAAESARMVDAIAYTIGRDVFFDARQYAPSTTAGRRLLAHELTHVVQQAGAAETGGLRIGEAGDSFEREAANTAREVTSTTAEGARVPEQRLASVLQRQPAPGGITSTDLEVSPLGASMLGSTTIDRFALGKADLTDEHKKKLAEEAATINRLLRQYPDSFVSIVGHTDAVGTEERNVALGQRRADAVLAELSGSGVPADIMRASSLGESSLLAQNLQGEPRNRRVEVFLTVRNLFKPRVTLTPPGGPTITPGSQTPEPQPTTLPPGIWRPLPPALKTSDPIEDALNRDPLLRALPKFSRDAVKDALKSGDETLADMALDALNTDDQTKSAIKVAVKALLQTLKGQKWKTPTPPLHEPPPSNMPEMPKAPGEQILTLPPIRF